MKVRIVYKKGHNSFITIESEVTGEDSNFLYLSCGKYLIKNIVSLVKIKDSSNEDSNLEDDA